MIVGAGASITSGPNGQKAQPPKPKPGADRSSYCYCCRNHSTLTTLLYAKEVHLPTMQACRQVQILVIRTVARNVVGHAYFLWLCMLVHA